ncbi:hypothetical protein SSX86_016253 [Deinandra increscens subsp. villosa]|uniref:CCHC-type domain-containing protein n=1 Tax=Deinandra increscens subsp. villosa TaxID=3103831 RepID=A0AAP0CXL3_9ASTR
MDTTPILEDPPFYKLSYLFIRPQIAITLSLHSLFSTHPVANYHRKEDNEFEYLKVLGIEDQYKTRLATYKLEEDAHNWWESVLQERGGEQFAKTLTWANFCEIFFDKYFSNVDLGAYKREYSNIRQQSDESLADFTDRFYRLTGFLGASAGTAEEQAEKYQWAVCDRIRRAIIHSTFANVADVVKAAKRVDMERTEFLSRSDSKKRDRDGNRVQSSSQSSSQGPTPNSNERRTQGNNSKSWKGKNQNQSQNKPYQQPINAQPLNQRGNPTLTQHPMCNHCNKHHPGVCRRVSGACLRCGEMGHMIRNCPKNNDRAEGNPRGANAPPAGGRVFTMTAGEAANTPGTSGDKGKEIKRE